MQLQVVQERWEWMRMKLNKSTTTPRFILALKQGLILLLIFLALLLQTQDEAKVIFDEIVLFCPT